MKLFTCILLAFLFMVLGSRLEIYYGGDRGVGGELNTAYACSINLDSQGQGIFPISVHGVREAWPSVNVAQAEGLIDENAPQRPARRKQVAK